MKKRTYTPRLRAERQDQTRQRIVEATMALHEELGPRDTTISAIAERAGVQRLTVYRHFPDDSALFAACSSHWVGLHPPPDPADWAGITEPAARCRAALAALYAYYRRTERMWTVTYRDEDDIPALKVAMRGFESHLVQLGDDLAAAWGPSPPCHLRAVIGHCLRFSTWQSLDREGVGDADMADLAVRWLTALESEDQRLSCKVSM